jgi:outer membrane protein OmpA-like peptidoglycan-associated protein
MNRPALPLLLCALTALAAGPAVAADPALQPVRVRAIAQFDFDTAAVQPGDRSALLAEVVKLKDVSWRAVTAIGHADSVGDADYNRRLALRRAEAVREHLVSQGIPPALIRVESRGEEQPLADNAAPDGRARNRRTEVEFSGVRAAGR